MDESEFIDQEEVGAEFAPEHEERELFESSENEHTEEPELQTVEESDPATHALTETIGGKPEDWERVDGREGEWVFDGEKIFNPATGELYAGGADPEAAAAIQQEAARQWNEGGGTNIVLPTVTERTDQGERIHAVQLVLGERREDGLINVGWEWHIHEIIFPKDEEVLLFEDDIERSTTPSSAEIDDQSEAAQENVPDQGVHVEFAADAIVSQPENADNVSDRNVSDEGEARAPTASETLLTILNSAPERAPEIGAHAFSAAPELLAAEPSALGSLESLPVFEPNEVQENASELVAQRVAWPETPDFRATAIYETFVTLLSRDTAPDIYTAPALEKDAEVEQRVPTDALVVPVAQTAKNTEAAANLAVAQPSEAKEAIENTAGKTERANITLVEKNSGPQPIPAIPEKTDITELLRITDEAIKIPVEGAGSKEDETAQNEQKMAEILFRTIGIRIPTLRHEAKTMHIENLRPMRSTVSIQQTRTRRSRTPIRSQDGISLIAMQ